LSPVWRSVGSTNGCVTRDPCQISISIGGCVTRDCRFERNTTVQWRRGRCQLVEVVEPNLNVCASQTSFWNEGNQVAGGFPFK
jgi:hypothetical protein